MAKRSRTKRLQNPVGGEGRVSVTPVSREHSPTRPRTDTSLVPVRSLSDLAFDLHNANRGTDRGRAALERSLREYGPGRAVLIDRNGCIIAGNKTVEQAKRLNIPLRVVRTDGHHLIAVQRDDLDLATDPRAKALAIADNRVGELDLEWDLSMLKQLHAEGLDLSAFWTDTEFATLFADPTTGLTDENAVVEPGPTDIVRGGLRKCRLRLQRRSNWQHDPRGCPRPPLPTRVPARTLTASDGLRRNRMDS